MRITTWNINSVRIRLDLIRQLVAKARPDVLCLQETKVPNDLFPHQAFADMGFEHSAPCTALWPVSKVGHVDAGKIELKVNGEVKQSSDLKAMIWNTPETISYLSGLVELFPGDLIYTGTPEGVGPVVKGDKLEGEIAKLGKLSITIG